MNKRWRRPRVRYMTQITTEQKPLMDGFCPGAGFGWFLRQKHSTDEPDRECYATNTNTAPMNKCTFYSVSVQPRCWYTGRVSHVFLCSEFVSAVWKCVCVRAVLLRCVSESLTFHGSFEEDLAAAAGEYSIVAARCLVWTHQADFVCAAGLPRAWGCGSVGLRPGSWANTHTQRKKESKKESK